MAKKAFTPADVAEATGKSRVTIYRHLRVGKLPATKLGGEYLITRGDLAKYLGSEERVDDIFGRDNSAGGGGWISSDVEYPEGRAAGAIHPACSPDGPGQVYDKNRLWRRGASAGLLLWICSPDVEGLPRGGREGTFESWRQ